LKPAPFEYDDPRTLDEALALLAEHGEDAKVLAGGQSLVPLLNFRLARPARLVDVNRVDELAYLRRRGGTLRVGALARALAVERSPLVRSRWPLIAEAASLVAHPPIRARGTVAGSVAHADPAAELPAALRALDARFHVRSARGSRSLASADLFVSQLTTALEPDELLVEIEVPPLGPRTGTAFVEHARVHGDFAVAGVAAVVSHADDGTCARVALALCAAAPTPVRAADAERALAGARLDEAAARAAGELAARSVDMRAGGARYRKALVAELTARALLTADARAEAA
jgi:CO/xanthine dehydrogenase FAD-binding subunit